MFAVNTKRRLSTSGILYENNVANLQEQKKTH